VVESSLHSEIIQRVKSLKFEKNPKFQNKIKKKNVTNQCNNHRSDRQNNRRGIDEIMVSTNMSERISRCWGLVEQIY